MIQRMLYNTIKDKRIDGKAIIILGPRQVGKSTLIESILKETNHLFLNGDDPTVRETLRNINTEQLKILIGNHTTLFIDEAQRIDNIGLTIKIVIDNIKGVKVYLTGSSALDLNKEINESLTGRKWEYKLYPISWQEWENKVGFLQAEQDLENRLIYGFYPDVLNNPLEASEIISQLADSYLYKDILSLAGLRKPDKLHQLTQALAYQIGSEYSNQEIAQLIRVDAKTVDSYIDLLEKAFIVYRLRPYSKNLRNELKSMSKIYFYDNGIRNAVIQDFRPLNLRNDVGALWENFLITERLKYLEYHGMKAKTYFWRTKQQQEIDYIEVNSAQLSAVEFKWNPLKKVNFSKSFTNNYEATLMEISRENFRTFVMSKV